MASEVAQLKERLRLQAEAAFQGLHGYSAVAGHQIIRRRMQRSEQTFAELVPHIGEEAADDILVAAMENAAQKEKARKKRRRTRRSKRSTIQS